MRRSCDPVRSYDFFWSSSTNILETKVCPLQSNLPRLIRLKRSDTRVGQVGPDCAHAETPLLKQLDLFVSKSTSSHNMPARTLHVCTKAPHLTKFHQRLLFPEGERLSNAYFSGRDGCEHQHVTPFKFSRVLTYFCGTCPYPAFTLPALIIGRRDSDIPSTFSTILYHMLKYIALIHLRYTFVFSGQLLHIHSPFNYGNSKRNPFSAICWWPECFVLPLYRPPGYPELFITDVLPVVIISPTVTSQSNLLF